MPLTTAGSATEFEGLSLVEAVDRVVALLRSRHPREVGEGFPRQSEGGAALHALPPHIPKRSWAALGDLVKRAEADPAAGGGGGGGGGSGKIDGSRWISLRLDGTGFSKLLRQLRAVGLLPLGFSPEFAGVMQACARSLLNKFAGCCVYTQSDEMTLLIPPAAVVRGVQHPHAYNGRVQKLASLAAAHVTALFNFNIAQLAATKQAAAAITLHAGLLATFDCRVGSYATRQEALGLLLWRGYDCGINGVSDRVFQLKGVPGFEGWKAVHGRDTHTRLAWLHASPSAAATTASPPTQPSTLHPPQYAHNKNPGSTLQTVTSAARRRRAACYHCRHTKPTAASTAGSGGSELVSTRGLAWRRRRRCGAPLSRWRVNCY